MNPIRLAQNTATQSYYSGNTMTDAGNGMFTSGSQTLRNATPQENSGGLPASLAVAGMVAVAEPTPIGEIVVGAAIVG